MTYTIGIRREDSYTWERRTPLTPTDAAELQTECKVKVVVQSSAKRVFTDADYRAVGVEVRNDLADCPVIFGIKEVPIAAVEAGKTYVFFSHTIKGQAYNMPMLRAFIDRGCSLIDYERVTDEHGRRLIFFGRYAGLAGMIETLWALGQRLAAEGITNPFTALNRALDYPDLGTAQSAVRAVGARIARTGLPPEITPLVIGIAGYGNVSRGAQEVLALLPVQEIMPTDLTGMTTGANKIVYKVVFKEQDMVEPRTAGTAFALQDYYHHPERYRSCFERYLPHLDVLINAIYWEPRYPRLVTKQWVRENYPGARLRVIGDISCDVEGAVEVTVQTTEPDTPTYVYDPISDQARVGVRGDGPVIMAIDILPTELPREASVHFSTVLKSYVPAIARASRAGEFDVSVLPPEIGRALIVRNGVLTPNYQYLQEFLMKGEP